MASYGSRTGDYVGQHQRQRSDGHGYGYEMQDFYNRKGQSRRPESNAFWDGSSFHGQTFETGFDDPLPDYDNPKEEVDSDYRPKNVLERNFNETLEPAISEAEKIRKERDNPAFAFDEREINSYEMERRQEEQKNSEHVRDSLNYDRNQIERQRNHRQGTDGRESDDGSDEGFIIDRRGGRGWSVRRRRSKRVTIASPRDVHLSLHDGGKTLQRRSTKIRPRTQIIRDKEDIFKETDSDENKLPSNRLAKTKNLKQRIELLHKCQDVTAHTLAESLRDQILAKPQEKLGWWELWKYRTAMTWLQFKNAVKSWIYQLELWAGHLKVIEGHFGMSTMTYFRFLRWLMFLNLFITVIMLSLILVPFLALKPSGDSDFVSYVNACQSEYHFLASFFSQNYTAAVNAAKRNESRFQLVLDVLQGTGWLENTELFYGSYFNRTISVPLTGEHVYNMDQAYMFAFGAVFFLNFILLVKNSAKGLKEGVLSSGGSMTNYCNKAFGAWDFCISSKKTAKIRRKNILQEFQSELEFQRLQWRQAGRTTKEKAKLYFIRFVINILVLVILAGSLYLIYFSFTNDDLLKLQQDTSLNEIVLLILQYIPSVTITVLNVIVPVIFTKVVIAEDYMPAFQLKLTLTRTVLLRLASLGVLMGSLYDKLTSPRSRVYHPDIVNTICDNLQPSYNTSEPDQRCWETYVGQQLYKLLILNFLLVVIMTFVVKFPRKLIYYKLKDKFKLVAMVGQQQFDLNKSVLDLVYLQALCWLGLFFSPLIPALCCVMCFIFFYVQKVALMHTCEPTQQSGTSKSNSLFMTVLFLSFGLSAAPIVFMIGSISPSRGCGPFRVYSSDDYVMFDTMSNLLDTFPTKVGDILSILAQGGSMFVLSLVLCFLMYYFWAVSQAHHKMTKLLREQLKQEGKDKQFLLARVNEALSQGEISEASVNG